MSFGFKKISFGPKLPKINSLNKVNLTENSAPQPSFQSQISKPMNFTSKPNLITSANQKPLSSKQKRFLAIRKSMNGSGKTY